MGEFLSKVRFLPKVLSSMYMGQTSSLMSVFWFCGSALFAAETEISSHTKHETGILYLKKSQYLSVINTKHYGNILLPI